MTSTSLPMDAVTAAFINDISALPARRGISLDRVLLPSIHNEARIRRHFADGKLYSRLRDPYCAMIPVFRAPASLRTIRARVVVSRNDRYAKHILPIPENERRTHGSPSVVESLDKFEENLSIFTGGFSERLRRWDNIVIAGGAVLACMLPLPANARSPEEIRYYFGRKFPTSDIDIFLYGMTKEEAERRIQEIYEDMCNVTPSRVEFKRTKYTITIYSSYRPIQVVLRLFRSPAEILCNFDIDAACFLYDGKDVFSNARGLTATMRQANTVNIDYYSPEYNMRLVKYVPRGFEIYIPELDRRKLDALPCAILGEDSDGLAELAYLEWRFESEKTLQDMQQSLDDYLLERREHYDTQMGVHRASSVLHPYRPLVRAGRRSRRKKTYSLADCISFWDAPSPQWRSAFRPTTIAEWTAPAYLTNTTQLFFRAIRAGNRELVQMYLERADIDLNERDSSGKTAIRAAIESGAEEIACDLIDAGAFPDFGMTALLIRLVQSVAAIFDEDTDSEHFFSLSSDESEIEFVETVVDQPESPVSGIASIQAPSRQCACGICTRSTD